MNTTPPNNENTSKAASPALWIALLALVGGMAYAVVMFLQNNTVASENAAMQQSISEHQSELTVAQEKVKALPESHSYLQKVLKLQENRVSAGEKKLAKKQAELEEYKDLPTVQEYFKQSGPINELKNELSELKSQFDAKMQEFRSLKQADEKE